MKLYKLAIVLISCAFLASCNGLYSDEPLLDRSLASLPFGPRLIFANAGYDNKSSGEETEEMKQPAHFKAINNYYELKFEDDGLMRLHFYEVGKLGEEFQPLLTTKFNYIIEISGKDQSVEYKAAQIYDKDALVLTPRPKEEQIKKILSQDGSITTHRSKNYTSFSVETKESLGHIMSVMGTEPEAENLFHYVILD